MHTRQNSTVTVSCRCATVRHPHSFEMKNSGEMHGLTRVRQFTISEGHLIIRPDQVEEEFKGCVDLAKYCMTTPRSPGRCDIPFSLWDPSNREKYLGTEECGMRCRIRCARSWGISALISRRQKGAAFYGPETGYSGEERIRQRRYHMITIQLDMFLAERFDMSFVDRDGEKKRPYIIHRTAMGML